MTKTRRRVVYRLGTASPCWWLTCLCAGIVTVVACLGATAALAQTVSNYPCAGCITDVPPGYNPARPAPVLITLHGDEGSPSYISSIWDPVGEQAGTIVVNLQCPASLGCPGSWWAWLESYGNYDDAWIGRQVDQVQATYPIDSSREYLTGWSGGADYLGWYALAHANQYAAAALVAGGVPYQSWCPSAPLPTYFLMGSDDFRYQSGQPSAVKSILDQCGSPTMLTVLPSADHSGTIAALSNAGYARAILGWMEQHSRGASSPGGGGTSTPPASGPPSPSATLPSGGALFTGVAEAGSAPVAPGAFGAYRVNQAVRVCGTAQDGELLGASGALSGSPNSTYTVHGPWKVQVPYGEAVALAKRYPAGESGRRKNANDIPCLVATSVAFEAGNAWLTWVRNAGSVHISTVGYSSENLGWFRCVGQSLPGPRGVAQEVCRKHTRYGSIVSAFKVYKK